MKNIGITGITFFGGDNSIMSYIDDSGRFRYERGRDGAEFTFGVQLTPDREISIRVAVFDNQRSLNDLEKDAYQQVKRVLQRLGQIGDSIDPEDRIKDAEHAQAA